MNVWEYLSTEAERADRRREHMASSLKRYWLALAAVIFGIVGAVLFGLSFDTETTKTETSGHLWWKDETTTTTEVPLGTRLLLLFIGLVLLAIAALCVYLFVKRSRREAAQRKYLAILTGIEVMTVQEIAAKTRLNSSTVYRDIQGMIDAGVIGDFYIDYNSERVVSTKYLPKSSHKTVVACQLCGAHNELIVGITRACVACGTPLVLNTP
ncbi:hypothetical protein [Nocardioides caricicola]|uniref:HTH domain-containing protein n=1 Tax=Nocardioides caricicola TaxID=634770 RepID=A0ABW0MXJ2_9ACTN